MPDFAVKTAFTAIDRISPAFKNMEQSSSSFQKTASRAFMAIGTLAGGYLVNSFINAAAQAERLNTGFKSVFGGDATTQMQFVREETKRLGLELTSSADAYKSIAASAKGTAISNKDVQETFLGVSEAAAALQLTGEQSQGALLAISQIISKGKVSMEELRGQLGERIPGAMQIAARSMGVTTAELEKLVASGIPAEKFIPRFAAQMRKEFGPAAMDAANSFNASRNRFNNMTFDFKVGVGSVILPMLNDLMTAFTPALNLMVDFFNENQKGISNIVGILPYVVGLYVAWKIATYAVAAAQLFMAGVGWIKYLHMMLPLIYTVTGATNLWTLAQWALNTAMMANPIGLVILAITALIAAGVLIYKYWEPISEFFSGLWDGIVSGFNAAIDWIIQKFTAVVDWVANKWGKVKAFFGFAGDSAAQANNAMKSPNESGANLQAGNTNVNVYSNGTEAKAEVTPRRGAKVNMNKLGYQS